jgi:hypothetical protein
MLDQERSLRLKAQFIRALEGWPEEEHKKLLGELMYWGSVIPSASLWAGILSQISSIAQRQEISPEEVIEKLFGCWSADEFMCIFQVAS